MREERVRREGERERRGSERRERARREGERERREGERERRGQMVNGGRRGPAQLRDRHAESRRPTLGKHENFEDI